MRERVREEDGVRSVGKCGGKKQKPPHHQTSSHNTHDTSQTKDKNNKQTTSRVEASHTHKTSEGQRVEGGELKESLWGWKWEMCGG